MRCYCYYEPVGIYDDESQSKLIEVWSRSWKKSGYDPVVLNEGDAKQHPMYTRFNENVSKLPSKYGPKYDRACFMRWLAMAAQRDGKHGGGLLLDYDVISYGCPVMEPDPKTMKVFCEAAHLIYMGMVLGTRQQFESMSKHFADWVPDRGDIVNSKTYQGVHCSDLSLLIRIFQEKNYPKPDWLNQEFGVCGLYPRPSSRTSKAVHYGYEFIRDGFNPKWKHIEKVRPL